MNADTDLTPSLPDVGAPPPPADGLADAVTRLTAEQLHELRARADREAGPFLDPVLFRRIQHWVPAAHDEWATAVLGHDWAGFRCASNRDLVLLDLARAAEPDPPEPPRVAAQRAEAQRRAAAAARAATDRQVRRMAEWAKLRAALPVRVEVVHNYTSARHFEHYVQGVDHIMVREPLSVGRLRRDPNRPLCWTPSRDKNLQHFSDGYEDRVPECKACIAIAERIAR